MKNFIIGIIIGVIFALGVSFYHIDKTKNILHDATTVSIKESGHKNNIDKITTIVESHKEAEQIIEVEDSIDVDIKEKIDKVIEIPKNQTKIQENKQKEELKENKNSTLYDIQIPDSKQLEPIIELEEGIWNELGITKDQYYNKPMYSWEKVDFKTMNECLEYGNNYKPYLDGEVLYNCRDVLSASGNYLGVMFDIEKLN